MTDMENYCDREDIVASYLDRALPEEERLEFEEHLATCDSCLMGLISAESELREIAAEAAARDRTPGSARDRSARPSLSSARRPRPGGFTAVQTVFACCTAIVFAVSFLAMIYSYRFDPGYREGTHLLDRLLEVRETGALLLSDGAFRPMVSTYTVRGNRRLHVGLSLDTAERLKRTLARYPDNANVLSALGHYHMTDGQPDIALIYYERVLGVRPGDARALNNLAAALYRIGSFSEAEKLLLRAKEGTNTPAEVFYNLGVLYGETGERELQKVYIRRFLESAPGSPRAAEARRTLED